MRALSRPSIVEHVEGFVTVFKIGSASGPADYYLKLLHEPSTVECTCWGWRRWGKCKHVRRLLGLFPYIGGGSAG